MSSEEWIDIFCDGKIEKKVSACQLATKADSHNADHREGWWGNS
jgi:hypothetical protein